MNNISKTLIALAATLAMTVPANAATTYIGKKVFDLHEDASRPCAIFRLEGVTQADPTTTSGAPWFAIPRTHPGFTDLFAILLTAKAANLPVTIITDGTVTSDCGGFATVSIAALN